MQNYNVNIFLNNRTPSRMWKGGVVYSENTIKKACEEAENIPIIRYDENDNEVVVGVANKVDYYDGYIDVKDVSWSKGTDEVTETLNLNKFTSEKVKGSDFWT